MEEGYVDEAGEVGQDEVAKTQQRVRHVLDKRRQVDDLLEQQRLRRELRDYDFNLDD